MYIVIGLNTDEFNRGNNRPFHEFEQEREMKDFFLSYNGDTSRLRIFKATELMVEVTVKEMFYD